MTLLELIQTHPSYIDATNPTDQVIFDWLEESVTVADSISYTDLILWGADNGRRRKLFAAFKEVETAFAAGSASPYNNNQTNDLVVINDLFTGGGDIALTIDLSRNALRAIFNSVSGPGNIIEAADKNALYALSDRQEKRWTQQDEYNGEGDWTIGFVHKVRNG